MIDLDELDGVLRRWADDACFDAGNDMPRYHLSAQTPRARSTRVIAISLAAACILALAITLAITRHNDTSPAGNAPNSPGPKSSAPTVSASDCPPIASQPSADFHVRVSNQYLALAKHCYYVPAGVPLHLQFTTSSKTIAATIGKKLSMILTISKKPLTRPEHGRPGFSTGSTSGVIFATPRQTPNSPATRTFRINPLPAGRYVIALLEGQPSHASTLIAVPHASEEPSASQPNPHAQSTLHGLLMIVEPVSGAQSVHPGTVVLKGPTSYRLTVPANGEWRIAVKPGTYKLTGRLGGLPGRLTTLSCQPRHKITIRQGASVTVNVSCTTDAG
jgi:hypothetical protein